MSLWKILRFYETTTRTNPWINKQCHKVLCQHTNVCRKWGANKWKITWGSILATQSVLLCGYLHCPIPSSAAHTFSYFHNLAKSLSSSFLLHDEWALWWCVWWPLNRKQCRQQSWWMYVKKIYRGVHIHPVIITGCTDIFFLEQELRVCFVTPFINLSQLSLCFFS